MANDVEFTVEETGEIQKVKMEDERAMGQLVIVKQIQTVKRLWKE